HGHTYAGNPVACAAGLAAMTQLIEQDIVGNARRQGERLRQRLVELAERYPIIGDVRGAGLLQGGEFVRDRPARERFPAFLRPGKVVEREARARGLMLRCGNDFAALAPPLIVTSAEIDEMSGILGESIAAAQTKLQGTAH